MHFTYIVTNPTITTFYAGVTNNLKRRIREHKQNRGKNETFAGRYYCYKLLYFECHEYIEDAIFREKQIKNMSREEKIKLIKTRNPYLQFLVP